MTAIQEIFKKAEQIQIETEKARLHRAKKELERREKAFSEAEEFGRIHIIPTDHIFPNPNQPRKKFEGDSIVRLADNIRQFGILQPLTVRRIEGSGTANALFEIVAGERRYRAAKHLGLSAVPCIMIQVDTRRSAELAVIENIQREDLNMFEEAGAIASLIDMYDMTQEDAAKKLSVSQSYIANKLRLLRLTIPEREKILSYSLTERHARALLKIESSDRRILLIERINKSGLNVAATEALVERCIEDANNKKSKNKSKKLVLKDIRVFYNTIDRAVSVVKQAGVDVFTSKVEADGFVELTIRIPKTT